MITTGRNEFDIRRTSGVFYSLGVPQNKSLYIFLFQKKEKGHEFTCVFVFLTLYAFFFSSCFSSALLFSATFRKKIEKLARDILIDPIRVVQGDVGEVWRFIYFLIALNFFILNTYSILATFCKYTVEVLNVHPRAYLEQDTLHYTRTLKPCGNHFNSVLRLFPVSLSVPGERGRDPAGGGAEWHG